MRVLVAGASGFIGTELCSQLAEDGHTVVKLVRRTPAVENEFGWSPDDHVIDERALKGVDVVVNLAGASVGRIPWSRRYKGEILYSRVNATTTLAESMAAMEKPPGVFVSGSAVGYYGDRPNVILTEASAKGEGFRSDVAHAWELAAQLAPPATRVVTLRTGIVVGRGGMFTPLVSLTRVGLASRLGSGKQIWPWVSLYDTAAAIRHLLTSKLSGPVNIVGPTPASAAEITGTLAQRLNRWHPWVVPASILGLLGDAADVILASEHVAPRALLADGFEFRDETVHQAIGALVRSLD
jgi:uncharacterized protein (TIGR01777 family)